MQYLTNIAAARSRTAPISTAQIPSGQIELEDELSIPPDATGIALFAHGSWSSRPRGFNDSLLRMRMCE